MAEPVPDWGQDIEVMLVVHIAQAQDQREHIG